MTTKERASKIKTLVTKAAPKPKRKPRKVKLCLIISGGGLTGVYVDPETEKNIDFVVIDHDNLTTEGVTYKLRDTLQAYAIKGMMSIY